MQRTCAVSVMLAASAGPLGCAASAPSDAAVEVARNDDDRDDAVRPQRDTQQLPPPRPAISHPPASSSSPTQRAIVHETAALIREESPSSLVMSSADADDGSRYVAGVFSETLVLGAVMLKSQGGDDIFIARIRANGAVVWARAIGSKLDESAPKVTFSDGRLKLVAMTDGAVDCGQGPLNTWSSETFFLCTFEADGTPINGASFPTGRR